MISSQTQSRRFFTSDPKAVAHILNHPYDYPKPPVMRDALVQLLGNGASEPNHLTCTI